eukprot:1161073-Pelagomonas_calceolata.AAC.4
MMSIIFGVLLAKGFAAGRLLKQQVPPFKSRLVVAADGGASQIRQLAGFRTFGWKYNQRAVVATVQLEGASSAHVSLALLFKPMLRLLLL